MPLKQVSSLVDLSLSSVAENVVRHGQNFSRAQLDSDIYMQYKSFQFLSSDRILQAIENVYVTSDQDSQPHHFREFVDFLFHGRTKTNFKHYRDSLTLLFNEYSTCISLFFSEVNEVPDFLYNAVSCCQGLKCLQLRSCILSEDRFLPSVSWHSLIKLDLLVSTSTDSIIMHAFKSCPELKELKASGKLITDKCLLYLCQHNGDIGFCHFEGKCCDVGKNLEKLTLYGTCITELGAACALQHLPRLVKFLDGKLMRDDDNRHCVPYGICKLREAALLNEKPLPTFKLTTIMLDSFCYFLKWKVFECCPSIVEKYAECIMDQIHVFTLGESFPECITITTAPGRPVSLEFITGHLERFLPLKCFSIEGPVFEISDGNNVGYQRDPRRYAEPLEHIHLRGVTFHQESVLHFLTKLLIHAVSVKSLTVSGVIAEMAFMSATERNSFCKLEEISIHDADLRNISLKQLIHRGTNLRKITYLRCQNIDTFTKRHKSFARENNLHLVIISDDRNIRCCSSERHFTPWMEYQK